MDSMNYFLILYQILIQLSSHSRLRITTQSVIINMSCIFKICSHLEYNFFQQEVRLGMEGKMGDVIYSIVIPLRSNILIVLSLETSGTGNIDNIQMYIGWMWVHWCIVCIIYHSLVWFMVLNTTFNNISVISWQSVLMVEETRVLGINQTDLAQVIDKLLLL